MTEIDSLTQLQVEQFEVHAGVDGTIRYRQLREYDKEIFSPFSLQRSDVADFLGSKAAGAATMTELLNGLPTTGENGAHWVDMAGGLAVAQRQAAALQLAGQLGEATLTNVDLFDWADEMEQYELDAVTWSSGVRLDDSQIAPNLIIADASQAEIPEPADLITSVHGIQYFDDPLGAVANWYNQLNDDGLMIVSRGRAVWSAAISVEGADQTGDPFSTLFDQLDEQGVAYAVNQHEPLRGGHQGGFSTLAIQKQAETRLRVNVSPVERVALRYEKNVRYEGANPALELVAA